MTQNFRDLDLVLEIILSNSTKTGINIIEIYNSYFSKTKIQLSELQLKLIIEQLKKDNYITLKSLIDGVEYYTASNNATMFFASGGYQAQAMKENDSVQQSLKIRELELLLELSRNKVAELENRKTYKSTYITIIVVLVISLLGSFSFLPRSGSQTDPAMSDSVAVENTDGSTEAVKVTEDANTIDPNQAQTVDSVVADSIR